mmetsp:Transcript_2992/g.5073  ORF Transcript_2992/g.5073 Transcript_2992/m.5073 type:complete len:98 (+) Transcript_2992:694-987(+)
MKIFPCWMPPRKFGQSKVQEGSLWDRENGLVIGSLRWASSSAFIVFCGRRAFLCLNIRWLTTAMFAALVVMMIDTGTEWDVCRSSSIEMYMVDMFAC